MIKTITIPDLHGKSIWKDVDPHEYDQIIFLGDYLDDWDVSDESMLENLKEVINFKELHKDKVILLLGNHDVGYLYPMFTKLFRATRCSGFRNSMYEDVHKLLNDNRSLFQPTHQLKNHIWSHAGISEPWYENRLLPVLIGLGLDHEDNINLSTKINICFKTDVEELFDVGYMRGGNYPNGGIFWEDATDLVSSPYPNIHQIVGHTKGNFIGNVYNDDLNSHLTFTDCLDKKVEFYKLEV